MKFIFNLFLFCLFPFLLLAQQLPLAQKLAIKNANTDSSRFIAFLQADLYFEQINPDSANCYVNKAILLATKHNKKLCIANALICKGYNLTVKGNYGNAYAQLQMANNIVNDPKSADKTWQPSIFVDSVQRGIMQKSYTAEKYRLYAMSYLNHILGILMGRMEIQNKAIYYFKNALKIATRISSKHRIALAEMNLGRAYFRINKLDSALYFGERAIQDTEQADTKRFLGNMILGLGDVELKKGHFKSAKNYYYNGLTESEKHNNLNGLGLNYTALSKLYLLEKQKDSSLYFAYKALNYFKKNNNVYYDNNISVAFQNLFKCYQLKQQVDSANKYAGLALSAKDEFNQTRINNISEFQNLFFNDRLRLQSLEKEKVINENKIRIIGLGIGLMVILIIASILYKNNRQKHKTNALLSSTLTNLKATQTQLIQSEKMASLGELTAGIAHEIQNPLNFVNNFSEVSKELLEELNEELAKGDIEEAKLISGDVIQNLEKINHHGKRADAIVKGMLEHSRASSGVKDPTDINKLADEYLRLAYHGLRAKDKLFNAAMVTNFDEKLPLIRVIPQDIGRVLLNLFNNAFYSVNQKAKTASIDYLPEVTVSTFAENGKVIIKVKDNGNGIPEAIKDKIMQPFFTTKPTGEGTGLGLSLSYDIVVKGHGGNIVVDTMEGEFTAFTVSVPVSVHD